MLDKVKCKHCSTEFKPMHYNHTSFCSRECGTAFWAKVAKEVYRKNTNKSKAGYTVRIFTSDQPLDINVTLHELGYHAIKRQELRNGFIKYAVEGTFKLHKVKAGFNSTRETPVKAYCIMDTLSVLHELERLYAESMNLSYRKAMTKYITLLNVMESYFKDGKHVK